MARTLKMRQQPTKITLRLEKVLLEELRKLAQQSGRSLNTEIEQRLADSTDIKILK